MTNLPADVVELVIAARIVAFEDQSPEAIEQLDKASEAFASRVPWDNEPEDKADAAPASPEPVAFDWRCPACDCHSYARVDEKGEDGHYRPGSAVRCVNCKAVFNYPPASPPPVVGVTDDVRVLLDELDADAAYMFGRAAADGSAAGMLAEALREKLTRIRSALASTDVTDALLVAENVANNPPDRWSIDGPREPLDRAWAAAANLIVDRLRARSLTETERTT